jgi:phage gp45-like
MINNKPYSPFQEEAAYQFDNIPFIVEGLVVDTSDPDQMGRVRVHLPSIDGEEYVIDQLPWCEYASPFMGYTAAYPGGSDMIPNTGHAAYGFWAIPKLGSTVLVFFLNGNPSSRFYFAATVRLHRNRSLPAGRNKDFFGNNGPWGDAGDGKGNLNPIQPAYDNLRTQFQNKMDESETITRGAYERQVAQAQVDKDGKEGYAPNPADNSYLDCQTFCLVTPGRHALIMQDDPQFARLRIKTANGHQVIFDDANERIYLSTAKGNNWVELDQDGHINVFASDSISIRTGKDFNLRADGDVNIEAGGGVNIKAETNDVRVQAQSNIQLKSNKDSVFTACGVFDVSSETTLKITSLKDMDINSHTKLKASGKDSIDLKSSGEIKSAGSEVHLKGAVKIGGTSVDIKGGPVKIVGSPLAMNSGAASPGDAAKATDAICAEPAEGPTIVPGHEPWVRPESETPRGKYWKK